MIKHILMTGRQNPETPWFIVTEEFDLFREEHFISTGKIISREEEFSDNQLVKTVNTIFRSMEDYTEFTTAPIVVEMIQQRLAYNTPNEIVTRSEIQII